MIGKGWGDSYSREKAHDVFSPLGNSIDTVLLTHAPPTTKRVLSRWLYAETRGDGGGPSGAMRTSLVDEH